MADNLRFDLLKQEYRALRAEILQSISYQHQILLAGYGAAGAFFGYALSNPDYAPVMIGVPYILLGMAFLWTVESNRMVRASYYIGEVLWRAMRAAVEKSGEAHWPQTEWEHWIRGKTGFASTFRERQHRAQAIVVVRAPLIITLVISIISVWQIWNKEKLTAYGLGALGMCAIVLWIFRWRDLNLISDLGKTPTTDSSQIPPL